ncbi:MAG: hypothetical protein RL885_24635 [Planctomycetota bacterium]
MAMTSEKAEFIEELIARGIAAPGPIQKALKARFGSGVTPAELGPFVRGRGKTPPRSVRGAAPEREASSQERSAVGDIDLSAAQFVVRWGEGDREASALASSAATAEQLVEAAIQQGAPPKSVVVYRRRATAVGVRPTIEAADGPVPPGVAPAAEPRREAKAAPSGRDDVHGVFGGALFACQNLERLVRTLLWGKAPRSDREAATQRKTRRKKLARATLGQIAQQLERHFPEDPELVRRLIKVLRLRGRLAGSFFTEPEILHALGTATGRRQVIALCAAADAEARTLWDELRRRDPIALAGIKDLGDETWGQPGQHDEGSRSDHSAG